MRKYYGKHPETDNPIVITHGESGYQPIAADDAFIQHMNEIVNHNTPKDFQIAVGCSMYGWDTPLAESLS